MRAAAVIAVSVVVTVVVMMFVVPLLIPPDKNTTDTTTRSKEVAGFYGIGDFAGELLQSDVIQTNISEGNASQSIVFKGVVCQRISGEGTVFFANAKATEPDVIYRVYVNGALAFSVPLEVGSTASALNSCIPLVQKDFILTTGVTVGEVQVDLEVYVYSFSRGAGRYEVLATDQAILQ